MRPWAASQVWFPCSSLVLCLCVCGRMTRTRPFELVPLLATAMHDQSFAAHVYIFSDSTCLFQKRPSAIFSRMGCIRLMIMQGFMSHDVARLFQPQAATVLLILRALCRLRSCTCNQGGSMAFFLPNHKPTPHKPNPQLGNQELRTIHLVKFSCQKAT